MTSLPARTALMAFEKCWFASRLVALGPSWLDVVPRAMRARRAAGDPERRLGGAVRGHVARKREAPGKHLVAHAHADKPRQKSILNPSLIWRFGPAVVGCPNRLDVIVPM